MKNLTVSSKKILYYRIIFTALSWFIIITSITIYAFNPRPGDLWYGCFNVFKSLTYQTNLIVTIWLTLAIVWHNKPESINNLEFYNYNNSRKEWWTNLDITRCRKGSNILFYNLVIEN